MKIVIVGASFAGVSCALELRKNDQEMEIILLDEKATLGYFSGSLLQVLKGTTFQSEQDAWINEHVLKQNNIRLFLNEQVIAIHERKKELKTSRRTISYDYLVLASGSRVSPDRESEKKEENYFTVGRLKEDQQLLKKIELAHVITIVGAGPTGIELSDSLCQLGKKVRLIEQYSYPLFHYFDESFLEEFSEKMKQQPRLETFFNQYAQVKRVNHFVEITLGKKEISSELLIYSGSLQPNHDYLGHSISLHSDRTIRVNDQLQTSNPFIYAIGNLIQQKFPLTNDFYFMPSKENAIRTGMAVARILVGKQKKYEGSLRPISFFAFGFYLGSVGLLFSDGFLYDGTIQKRRQTYLICEVRFTIQYVYNQETKQLLGVQVRNNTYSLSVAVSVFEEMIRDEQLVDASLDEKVSKKLLRIVEESLPKKGR